MTYQNDSLNILMISLHGYIASEPELGKPDTGGQVSFVLDLAKRFTRLGHSVDVVTRQFEDQENIEEINPNLRIRRIPFGGKEFIRKEDMHDHISDFVTNLLAIIRKGNQGYDVINSHYWDAGWAGQRISEQLEIPHIHTPHSLGWWKREEMKHKQGKIEGQYRFEERINKEYRIYSSCEHIIATTEEQKEIIEKHYDVNEKHITILPPGIDESRFYPVPKDTVLSLRKKFDMTSHDILLLGRLADNKGYDLFIKAIPYLRKTIEEFRVLFALGGNDDERDDKFIDYLKEMAQKEGVSQFIEWREFIEEDNLPKIYQAAKVFVLPSRYEPFGMVATEAIACGTPSVITRHGALHKNLIFGQHALFADPEAPQELAMMVSLLMKYEDLSQEISREGSRFVRRKYGWTGIAQATLDLFKSMIHIRRFESMEI